MPFKAAAAPVFEASVAARHVDVADIVDVNQLRHGVIGPAIIERVGDQGRVVEPVRRGFRTPSRGLSL